MSQRLRRNWSCGQGRWHLLAGEHLGGPIPGPGKRQGAPLGWLDAAPLGGKGASCRWSRGPLHRGYFLESQDRDRAWGVGAAWHLTSLPRAEGKEPRGRDERETGGPSSRSAALRLLGELAQGGSRQAGALLALRMAWTPRSDHLAPSAPDRPLSPGEAFLLPWAWVAEKVNLRRVPEFQPRALQGPGSLGPSRERSRPRASSSRWRTLMVAAGGRRPGEGGSGEAGLQRQQGHHIYKAGGLHNRTHRRSEGRRPRPGRDSNK